MISEKIPAVNWPEKNGVYKVVQIIIKNQPYLRFGKDSFAMNERHFNVLEEILRISGISYETKEVGDLVIPREEGEDYEAVGMGLCLLGREEKFGDFFDRSIDYYLSIDADHLAAIQKLESGWALRKTD